MCGPLKKLLPFSGFNIAHQAVKHSPAPKPLKKVAKFASRGGLSGVAARSMFGD